MNPFPLVLSLFRLNEKRGENHSLERGMLLLLLSLFKAVKACDLVTLPTDDGVSIGFETRRVWVTGKLTFFRRDLTGKIRAKRNRGCEN